MGTVAVSWVNCFSMSACPTIVLLLRSDVEELGMIGVVHVNLHVTLVLFISSFVTIPYGL
jgi:hypothetical protein